MHTNVILPMSRQVLLLLIPLLWADTISAFENYLAQLICLVFSLRAEIYCFQLKQGYIFLSIDMVQHSIPTEPF